MLIERNAFQNCCQLKELHFEDLDKVVNFKNKSNSGIAKNYIVVVPDHLYDSWIKSNYETHAVKASLYIQKIMSELKKCSILTSIFYIDNAYKLLKNNNTYNTNCFLHFLEKIVYILKHKYNLLQDNIEEFYLLQKKKEYYESKK